MRNESLTEAAGKLPSPLAVLVAEDDPSGRCLLRYAFERIGIPAPVRYVENGQQAIDYLSGKSPFDDRLQSPLPGLLLLDLKMPVKDGFDVLEWLRWQSHLASLAVVVFSASNYSQDVARARALGARHYLVKPAGFSELVQLVRSLEIFWRTLTTRVAASAQLPADLLPAT